MNDIMTRQALHQDFMANPGVYKDEAKANKVDIETLFERKSGEKDPGYPEDVLADILYREGLVINASKQEGTSTVHEFLEKGEARAELFWTILDKDYDQALGLTELEKRDISGSDGSFNSPFNPAATTAVYERHRFMPKITLSDIASRIEVVNDLTFQQPEYVSTKEDEETHDIAQGTPIPTTRVRRGKVQGETKKFGGGISFTDEFALNQANMGLVRMLIRRQAMRDEIKIVNDGLSAALGAAGSDHDIDLQTGTISFDDLLELSLFDGGLDATRNPNEDNGYQLLAIFANKDVTKRLMTAYSTVDNPGVFSQYPPDRFGNFWNPIQLINSGLGGPTRLGRVRDNAVQSRDADNAVVDTIDNGTALGLDTRYALVLFRGQSTSESHRNPQTQVEERYNTQRFGWLVQDPDACFNIGA